MKTTPGARSGAERGDPDNDCQSVEHAVCHPSLWRQLPMAQDRAINPRSAHDLEARGLGADCGPGYGRSFDVPIGLLCCCSQGVNGCQDT